MNQPEEQGPAVGGPQVGGPASNAGTGFLLFLVGAAAAGFGVWYVMREKGALQAYSPIKNLATGDIACLPETATGQIFGGGA